MLYLADAMRSQPQQLKEDAPCFVYTQYISIYTYYSADIDI